MPSKWSLCVVPWDLYATYLIFRLSVRSSVGGLPPVSQYHQRGRSRRAPLRSEGYTDMVNSIPTKCQVEGNSPNSPGESTFPFNAIMEKTGEPQAGHLHGQGGSGGGRVNTTPCGSTMIGGVTRGLPFLPQQGGRLPLPKPAPLSTSLDDHIGLPPHHAPSQ